MTVSLNEYFKATSPPQPTILGLLGCGCSAASDLVAEIIHHNSLSQVDLQESCICIAQETLQQLIAS